VEEGKDDRSLRRGTVVLGVLLSAAFPAIFASAANLITAVPAVAAYVVLLVVLATRARHRFEVFWASVVGGAPAALLVLGFGGLVAVELSRLTGSSTDPGVFYVLVGGTVLGTYLAVGLTALAAGGVTRPWLPIATMLLVPVIGVSGSSFFRDAVANGATVFNYGLLAAVFAGFGAVAWPRVRAQWRSALEEIRHDEEREREEKAPDAAPKPDDPEQAAIAAAKADLKEKLAAELKGIGVALSGGGHRAALFDLGVLLYLVRAAKHREIAQISSVSGGSMTNGYVGRSLHFRHCTVGEFDTVAGRFAGQLADRGTLFAYWQSKAYVAGLILTGLVSLVAFAFWIRHPQWLPQTWLVPATAIAGLVFLGYFFLQRGAVCRWAFRKSLYTSNGRPVQLSELSAPPLHVLCATELQTGSAAYFLNAPFVVTRDSGPSIEYFPTLVSEGFQTAIMNFELTTAVQASASLPGAFPPVKLPVRGWFGITRRAVARTWERVPAPYMLLVDGGVRDNLGIEWFLRSTAADTTLLIVVNGAANKARGHQARVSAPWLGDIRSLLLVKDLPYNSREQNRREELLGRFLPSYRGVAGDITGAILHIEESPYDLAEALDRTVRQDAFESWLLTPEDIRVSEALRQRSDFAAIRNRAAAVRAHLEKAEDIDALKAAKAAKAHNEVGRTLASMSWASVLVPEEWDARAYRNSTLPTHLNKLGRPAAAELMRHSFALAMAKLHILFDFPLCDLPSIDELQRLMSAK